MMKNVIKKYLLLLMVCFLIANHSSVMCQDFFNTYKSEFLDPYKKVNATPNKDDDKFFFQEQIKRINNYNPPSLQRFIAKQIVTLAEPDIETQSECLEAGLILARKNWLRGKEKIELLKKLDKIADTYQNSIKYDKKKEKLDLYKISYQIELDITEENLAVFKVDDAKSSFNKWERTADNVRDPRLMGSFDLENLRLKTKQESFKSLIQCVTNLKSLETNPTYKKAIAYDCLRFLFSPESALAFLEGSNSAAEMNMITAFSKFLNKQTKTAKAPYYFSERDLTLPPPILFERLAQLKEIQPSASFIKEKFDNGEFQYFHHARDIVREMINRYPDDAAYDEKELVAFFAWVDSILRGEAENAQLFFLYQLKPKIAEAKAEIQDPQNLASLVKSENFFLEKITALEKNLKLFKYRIPAPGPDEENLKEKKWLAKTAEERQKITDAIQEKVRKSNPNADRLSFWFDQNSMTLNLNNDSQIENLSDFKDIPLKIVNINHCGFINDFSFLKDSPVVTIDASWSAIKTINALKGMKTLRNLNLSGIRLYDIADLKGLNLTSLNIGHNPIKDLTPLKGMPLTDLNIERTSVATLTPLDSMPLTNLNANDCKLLKDIEALENTNIRILRLNGCDLVSTLDSLSKQRLTELYIEETAISDLTPIAKSMLTHFYFSKCLKIRGLISETAMMNIENIGINNHQLLSVINKYEFPIRSLRMNSTSVQDLTPIKDFEFLETLDISECDNLRDLKTLKNPTITNLIAHGCKSLKTYNGISETNIKNLYANNSEVRELSALVNSKVEKIEMRDSEIISLKGISSCPSRDVDFRGSKKLRDIADLENAPIEYLWLGGTTPKGPEVIKKMRNLKFTDWK